MTINPFRGNNYKPNVRSLIPRYHADEGIVIGKDEVTSKKIKVDSFKGILYGLRPIRMNLYPYNSNKKAPKCFSDNNVTPTSGLEKQNVTKCSECPLSKWNNDKRPECDEATEVLVLDVDRNKLCFITFKGASKDSWKKLETQVMSKVFSLGFNKDLAESPYIRFVFEFTSVEKTVNNTEVSVFSTKIINHIPDEDAIKHLHKSMNFYNFAFSSGDDFQLTDYAEDNKKIESSFVSEAPQNNISLEKENNAIEPNLVDDSYYSERVKVAEEIQNQDFNLREEEARLDYKTKEKSKADSELKEDGIFYNRSGDDEPPF